MTEDRPVDDDDPEPFSYDTLTLALAVVRAFADPDRRAVEGMELAQLLTEENEPIRAVEAIADVSSAALILIARKGKVDLDATLSEIAVRIAKGLNE